MNELTRKCLLLPDGAKLRLISILNASMEDTPENDGSRFTLLYKAAQEVVGKGILTNCRFRQVVIGRAMIVYQMRTEGFTLKTIGRHLVRHHAAVYHLQKKMEDVIEYPNLFPLEMDLWKRFQEKIKEYEARS